MSLLFLNWDSLAKKVREDGVAIIGIFSYILLISNGSESRHMIAFLPLLTFFLFRGIPEFTWYGIFCILVIQIPISRFYTDYFLTGIPSDPYFLTMGPWITPTHYYGYFIIAFCLFIVMTLLSYKNRGILFENK